MKLKRSQCKVGVERIKRRFIKKELKQEKRTVLLTKENQIGI